MVENKNLRDYINALINLFIEMPTQRVTKFEFDNCPVKEGEYYYTFDKTKFEYAIENEPNKHCYFYKQINEEGEEIYHNFCPEEEFAIPVYPFLIAFYEKKVFERKDIKGIVLLISVSNYGCLEENEEYILIEITEKNLRDKDLTANISLFPLSIEYIDSITDQYSEFLWVFDRDVFFQVKEILEGQKNNFIEEGINRKTIEYYDRALQEAVSIGQSDVHIPKKIKTKNIGYMVITLGIIAGLIIGYKKYVEYKRAQEMAKRKEWIPTERFKRQHIAYYFLNENKKFAKLASLLKPSEVKIEDLTADKRGYSVIWETYAPLKGFMKRGGIYTKLEKGQFTLFPGWKMLRYKPPQPLEPLHNAYEKFKHLIGPDFEIETYSPQRIQGVLLNCVELNLKGIYPLYDTKEILKRLSYTQSLLERLRLSQTNGGNYNIDINIKLCGF